MSLGHPSLTRLSSFFLMLFHCFLTHLQGLSGFVLCWFVVQEAFLIFAVNCTFGLSLHPHYRGFFATMVSADFLPFVVTAEGMSSWLDGSFRWQALPGKVIHLSFHIPAAFTPDSHPQLLRLCAVSHARLRLWPYMRFVFLRPELCRRASFRTPVTSEPLALS